MSIQEFTIHDCPVKAETRKIQELGDEMMKSLRRLRRSIKACETCPLLETCTFRQQFNQIVDQVIDEVLDTWQFPADS